MQVINAPLLADSLWVSGLLLILAGLAASGWVVINRGLGIGLLFAAVVLAASFGVEYAGVRSGSIFGRYAYTNVLAPLIADTVPLAIPFAWIVVVLGSWAVASALLPGPTAGDPALLPLKGRSILGQWPSGRPLLLLAVTAGLLTMLLDLLIEPVAVYLTGFWRWLEGGPYYGVPTVNFVAWAVVGTLLGAAAGLLIGRPKQPRYPWLPPLLYTMNALQFGLVAGVRGYPITGGLGLLAVALGLYALLPAVRAGSRRA